MTLRELLSCFDENATQKITLRDNEWRELNLNICFNPGDGFEWVFEEDMHTLDQLSDLRITKWYVAYGAQLRIYLDGDFEEVLG